ncbi:S8 family peptidase [Clostridium aminobutyricum]|uniref:S8 family peptidase n=1 Tax=Clostridium aminobutyricum TaxID=33953 RepID=A0A939DAX7_CLOAM|nr:S8 family peptidase [Clostridium aminobutyricum]MBN7774467.1 S8 family peptidase [Clostridium aminobutyricum]
MKSGKGTMPVIIYSKRTIDSIRDCVLENYGTIKYELPFINALCVEVPAKKLGYIKCNADIALISKDAVVSKLPIPETDTETELSRFGISSLNNNLSKLFKKLNSSKPKATKCTFSNSCGGDGVTIAIIDTGLAPHYDVIKPTNRILAFKDFVNNAFIPYDDDGHGTHVAGIAAGSGYLLGGPDIFELLKMLSPEQVCNIACMGTAPNAKIVALKALDQEGNGSTSDILAAMQWVADNHLKYNIRVVNLSLGIDATSFDINGDGIDDVADPLVLGANALVNKGITVVTAAGNGGPEGGTISSPGTSPYVITVGSAAYDKGKDSDSWKWSIPEFSSRGPTANGTTKPDIVAPGVEILSLSANTGKQYLRQSGTSMSAPAVAGAAACLHAAYPKLSPAQVKRILMSSAVPLSEVPTNAQGAGLLNL